MRLDATALMRQAHMTAHDYMLYAKEDVDRVFGSSASLRHPELVVAYMNACVVDFNTAIMNQRLEDITAALNALRPAQWTGGPR